MHSLFRTQRRSPLVQTEMANLGLNPIKLPWASLVIAAIASASVGSAVLSLATS
jgi:hypothetical protein